MTIIDLSHIPTAKIFSSHMAGLQARADYDACGIEGAKFSIGQSVRTNLGKRGEIVAIDGNHVSIEINGCQKKFHATTIKAV
jgi:hypothetical protein